MSFTGRAYSGGTPATGELAILRNSSDISVNTGSITYELNTTLYDPHSLIVSNTATVITLRSGSYLCELWFPVDGQAGEVVYTLSGDGTDISGSAESRSSCRPSFCQITNNNTTHQISVFVSDADDLAGSVAAGTGLLFIRKLP